MLTSYPKEKINILLLENISRRAVDEFARQGYDNIMTVSNALTESELAEAVKGVHILGIRSKTKISAKALDAADKLLSVGAFCIGTNQIDLEASTKKGIAVFNAPYSNTRSVAELVIGAAVMLIRRIPDRNIAAHEGIWLKDAKGCFELRGKTLGIIGYGNIGSQVSVLAEAMGLNVIYHDIVNKMPLGNAKQVRNLGELLESSDLITLHVPSDETTRNMIGGESLSRMRRGSILINYSRGDVVDLDATASAVKEGILSGVAVDVYPKEPESNDEKFETVLQGLPNVLLTPHIGGSTEEAQSNIAVDVTSKLVSYLETGSSNGSLTVPAVALPQQEGTHRILHIHENVPGVLGEINTRLSELGLNILGQYLKTNESIGYVILDVERNLSGEAVEALRKIGATIRTRLLY
jgi:D-3-phosphoglycerate dehydrogenase / 2-oxoglutarate reductase